MKIERIKTQAQLARALHVSRQVVSYHIRQSDAPKERRDGSFDVTAWLNYLATSSRLPAKFTEQDRHKIAKLKLRKLTAETLAVERANQRAAGETMLVSDARKEAASATGFFFSELQRLEQILPGQFHGCDAVGISQVLDEVFRELRSNARTHFDEIGATPK